MMRWEQVSSWQAFQNLVGLLVLHLDPWAVPSIAEGRDGGQDVISGDRSTVYQAKYTRNTESPDSPVKHALKELDKIRKYRVPGHERFDQWSSVGRWVLVRNAPGNASHWPDWDGNVVPAFKALDIDAEYWERSDVERELLAFPDLCDAVFENKPRAFLTLGEALERARKNDPAMPALRGRDALLTSIADRLQPGAFVDVHGGLGAGTSRVALAIAERARRLKRVAHAYFVNAMNLASDGGERLGLGRQDHALVVVDDVAEDEDGAAAVKRLAELVASRGERWTVLVSRKTHQRRMARAVHDTRRRAGHSMEVSPLETEDTRAIFVDAVLALDAGTKDRARDFEHAARIVARRSGGAPGWAVLAARTVTSGGTLGRMALGLREGLEGVLAETRRNAEETTRDASISVMRHIALLGTLDLRSDAQREWVRERTGKIDDADLSTIIDHLVRDGLVRRRASAQLCSITSTILADAALAEWLTTTTAEGDSRLNERAIQLARWLAGELRDPHEHDGIALVPALRSLAMLCHTAAEPAGVDELLLRAFADARQGKSSAQALARHIKLAEGIAFFLPEVALQLAGSILRLGDDDDHHSPPDYIGGSRFPDIRDRVGRLLFAAGQGARTVEQQREVLRVFLLAMRREVAQPKAHRELLRHNAIAASRFFDDLVEQIDRVPHDYAGQVEAEAQKLLSLRHPSPNDLDLAELVVARIIATEGFSTTSDGNNIYGTRYTCGPQTGRGQVRRHLLDALWRILRDEPASPWRLFAWDTLHRARDDQSGDSDELEGSDGPLSRTEAVLTARPDMSLTELTRARGMWAFYITYGDRFPIHKAAAERCEQVFAAARARDPYTQALLSDAVPTEVARALAGDGQAVAACIRRLHELAESLDDERARRRASNIVREAGESARDEVVRAFALLAGDLWDTPTRPLLLQLFRGLLGATRFRGEQAVDALWITTDEALPGLRYALRKDAVEQFNPISGSVGSDADVRAFEPFMRELAAEVPDHLMRMLGNLMARQGTRDLVERAWLLVPDGDHERPFDALTEGVFYATKTCGLVATTGLLEWLLDQLVELEYPRTGPGEYDWHLDQLVRASGKVSVGWLRGFLARRAARKRVGYTAVPYGFAFHHFVSAGPEDADGVRDLFETAWQDHGSNYDTPAWLFALDDKTHVIPELLAARIAAGGDAHALSRIGEWITRYPEVTDEWRRLAALLCTACEAMEERDREHVYSGLTRHRGVYTSRAGKLSQRALNELEAAEKALREETDDAMRAFRAWRVKDARRTVEDEQKRIEADD